MAIIKHLTFLFVYSIIGIAIGFFVCKQTYQPLVAELKEKFAEQEKQVVALQADLEVAKNNVRLVFTHNEDCTIEDTKQ